VDDRRPARRRPDVHDRRRCRLRDLLGRDHRHGAGSDRETDPGLRDADPRIPPESTGRRESHGAVYSAGDRHRRCARRIPRGDGEPARYHRSGLRNRTAARGLHHVQAVRGDRGRAADGDAPDDAPNVWKRVVPTGVPNFPNLYSNPRQQ